MFYSFLNFHIVSLQYWSMWNGESNLKNNFFFLVAHSSNFVWIYTSLSAEQKTRLNGKRYKQNHFERVLEDLRYYTWLGVIGSTLNRALCQLQSRLCKGRMSSYELQTLRLQLNSLLHFLILAGRKFISTALEKLNTHTVMWPSKFWLNKILAKQN